MKRWNILYRGPLSSCNYDCTYCPFAKTTNTDEELRVDAEKLQGFVRWVGKQRDREIGVLFTPWGEALVRKAYRDAIEELSHMPNTYRVAIQTNLSAPLSWLDRCNKETVGLWTTFHPSQTSIERFVERCETLKSLGIRHSVGTVGLKEQFAEIRELRERVSPDTYVWVNAYKREADYYSSSDIDFLSEIDPLFDFNNQRHPSLGKNCRGGQSSFTVDGEGDVRRCHFIERPIGSIYESDVREALEPSPCTNETCGCHIGYVHMPDLGLYNTFGDGVLERIPASFTN